MSDSNLLPPPRISKSEIVQNALEKGCLHKHSYSSKGLARRIAAQQSNKSGTKIQAYKCAFGRHWHIGHPPREKYDRETLRELYLELKTAQ